MKPINKKELVLALKTLKNNKSPGTDGLPAEWYRAFEEELSPILLKALNWTLEKMTIRPKQS